MRAPYVGPHQRCRTCAYGNAKKVWRYLRWHRLRPSGELRKRLIPLAPALPTFGDERVIGARLQLATDKMLIAPEATA